MANKKKLYMPPLIRKYYEQLFVGPTFLRHHSDEKKFFHFVKASIRYGGRSNFNGSWLRKHLEVDLQKLLVTPEEIEIRIRETISLFDSLIDFYKTPFPNLSIEDENYKVSIYKPEIK
jgi:hypothetical protein